MQYKQVKELCDSLCTNAMGYDANKEFEKYKKI
jgi:hypothetical protein